MLSVILLLFISNGCCVQASTVPLHRVVSGASFEDNVPRERDCAFRRLAQTLAFTNVPWLHGTGWFGASFVCSMQLTMCAVRSGSVRRAKPG